MKPEGSLQSRVLPSYFSKAHFKIILPTHSYVFQAIPLLRSSQPKPCTHISSQPRVSHAPINLTLFHLIIRDVIGRE